MLVTELVSNKHRTLQTKSDKNGIIYVTPISILDSSYPSSHGSAVATELILGNSRPFFHQYRAQLLLSFRS